jgi:peptide/nickel transport system substrate-binding protein
MTRTKKVLLATAAVTLALTGAVAAQDVPREDTVIFDLDRTIRDPENFNWMTDGSGIRRMHGAHQTMWEPLFILNYGTGELDPWLATGFDGQRRLDRVHRVPARRRDLVRRRGLQRR